MLTDFVPLPSLSIVCIQYLNKQDTITATLRVTCVHTPHYTCHIEAMGPSLVNQVDNTLHNIAYNHTDALGLSGLAKWTNHMHK